MENKKVGIILVNYNGKKFQNDCIDSILKSSYGDYCVIVVDNGSTDGSMEMLGGYNDERIIPLLTGENGGFSKANNIGVKKAEELGCTHVLFLNNDTVVHRDFLTEMLSCGDKVVAPKIYFYGTRLLWYGGGKISRLKGSGVHLNYKKSDGGVRFKKYYNFASGCCMLFDLSVLRRIGLWDEKYFLYYEDADLCARLNKAGISVRFCEKAVVEHKVSLSTGGENSKISLYYGTRNRLYFIKKNKLGTVALLFTYVTRYLKILKSKIKKDGSGRFIEMGIDDYKRGIMYRSERI